MSRAGLYKYLAGTSVPSLRVLRNAKRHFGVRLSYGELGDSYIKARRRSSDQLELEFSVGGISKEQVEVVKISPKGERSLEVTVRLTFSATA